MTVETTTGDVRDPLRTEQALESARGEVERLSAELLRADEDFRQFLYAVSHDFTEPLQVVLSYAELLASRQANQLDERTERFTAGIRAGAERIRALIDDLLVYSRLERRPFTIEDVDCAEVIAEAIDELSERIEESGAKIRSDAHATLAADRADLARLFGSLLDNAVKFRASNSPEIRVLVTREQEGWCVCVRDDGIGIDPDQQDRIFEMFQRLHTQEEYPGTGAGLAICKKIVDRHGGRIWVDSAPGLGSTFYFTIPFHERGEAS
jgi:light-regulated signal transduction histidine kinase (bacteriophytochrome)